MIKIKIIIMLAIIKCVKVTWEEFFQSHRKPEEWGSDRVNTVNIGLAQKFIYVFHTSTKNP